MNEMKEREEDESQGEARVMLCLGCHGWWSVRCLDPLQCLIYSSRFLHMAFLSTVSAAPLLTSRNLTDMPSWTHASRHSSLMGHAQL